MRKLVVAVAGTTALALSSVALGHVAVEKVSAQLGVEQEVPMHAIMARGGSGTFTGTLNNRTLTWRLTFTGLSGPAIAAHIHIGKPGVAGPVTLPLCTPCKSGLHGKHRLTRPQLRALTKGGTYVNVHTKKNPNGEIRGQIKVQM